MNFMNASANRMPKGVVHCPICTRTVEARIVVTRKRPLVKPGQRCPHCAARLDAGSVLRFDRAA